MLIIKDRGFPATLDRLVAAVQRTGLVRERWPGHLKTALIHLCLGPERFGEVDLDNDQQVALVAYRVTRSIERADSSRLVWREPEVYELAVIGAGTTTAYFLDTLGPAYDHSATIVIGEENPWIRQRGRGITYINHTWRQIGLPSANVTEYGGNESFADRTLFGRWAERVIENTVHRWERAAVRHVEKVDGTYFVSYGRAGRIRARRVVFAAGAGSLRTPPEVRDDRVRNRARIIDMSTFIRDKVVQERGRGRVVIWGSNAAIDAVAAAKVHGWTIAAWIYSVDGPPAWLPGTRYLSEPYRLQDVPRHPYRGRDAIKIEDSGELLKVLDTGRAFADEVTYVVYGLGSEDLLTERGLMDVTVLENNRPLQPILDTAGVFGDPIDGGRQTPAFLGWQNPSGTFRVFGLSAENYAGVIRGGRGSRIAPDDPRVMALKSWLSGDVLTVGQLTYIRSALRAVNNYIPGSIEHRVDYSHADANTLRVHLAARYPDLPEEHATWFISMIRRVRSGLQARLPHGFTAAQVDFLEQQLRRKQQEARRGGARTRIDAVNWQWALANRLREMTPAAGEEVASGLLRIPVHER